jgi:hypothetical protein
MAGSFIELIGLGADFEVPDPDEASAPFARTLAAYLERGEGLAMVALRSPDADADADAFAKAGIGTGRMLRFGRSSETPDGTRREVAFSLAFVSAPGLPEAGFFTCQHHRPDNFWNPAVQQHPNGVRAISRVTLVAAAPMAHAPVLAALFGAASIAASPEGIVVETGGGTIEVLPHAQYASRYGDAAVRALDRSGGFAAATFVTESPQRLAVLFKANGIVAAERGDLLIASAVQGLTLVFEAVPKDLT